MKDIIDRIDEYLLNREHRLPREAWYPSEFLKCARELFYRKKHVEPSNPIEAGALWKMEMGNALHEMVGQFIKEAIDPEVREETEFEKPHEDLDWPVSGRTDLQFRLDGKEIVADVKTSYGRGIKTIQQLGQAKPEHVAQCLVYLWATGAEECWLIYVGRDNAYRTLVLVSPQASIMAHHETLPRSLVESYQEEVAIAHGDDMGAMVRRLAKVEEQIQNDHMPDRDFQAAIKDGEIKHSFQADRATYKSDWQCSYCSWRDLCWSEYLVQPGDNREMFH